MTADDAAWMVALGRKRYPSNYDGIGADAWFCEIVLKSPMMFHAARTENAFCISMLTSNPWTPAEFEVHVVAICSDDGCMWETLPLLRDSIAFAERRKAWRWNIVSETAFDLGPLALRVGAKQKTPRYSLDLRGLNGQSAFAR